MKHVYITMVDSGFLEYFEMLKKSYLEFSSIPLICFTVNHEPDIGNDIKTIPIYDMELGLYSRGESKIIKNNADRVAYIIGLKAKIFRISCDLGYDSIMYIDSDCIFTPKSDNLVNLLDNSEFDRKFPLCTRYWHQYTTTHNRDGNIDSYPFSGLFRKYGGELIDTWYKTSYCMYFSKESKWFFEEAESILLDPDNFLDRKNLMYLCDETVFNYLYSKYDFHDGIGPGWCKNIGMNLGEQNFIDYHNESFDYTAFYHMKNYIGDINKVDREVYDEIIDYMKSHKDTEGIIRWYNQSTKDSIQTLYLNDLEKSGNYDIWLEDTEDPIIFNRYNIEMLPGIRYFILNVNESIDKPSILFRKLPIYFGV